MEVFCAICLFRQAANQHVITTAYNYVVKLCLVSLQVGQLVMDQNIQRLSLHEW